MKNPDDELCLCFHVTRRKIENWIRIEKPKRVSQLSECGGAGTGCGWCRPFLQRLFDQATPETKANEEGQQQPKSEVEVDYLLSVQEYAQLRAEYRKKKKTQAGDE